MHPSSSKKCIPRLQKNLITVARRLAMVLGCSFRDPAATLRMGFATAGPKAGRRIVVAAQDDGIVVAARQRSSYRHRSRPRCMEFLFDERRASGFRNRARYWKLADRHHATTIKIHSVYSGEPPKLNFCCYRRPIDQAVIKITPRRFSPGPQEDLCCIRFSARALDCVYGL
jgi:hypothetical protein